MKERNLILDLGGVILKVDYLQIAKTFDKYNIKDFEKIYTQTKQISLIDDFEEGRITIKAFRDGLRQLLNQDISDTVIDEAWNSMVLDFFPDIMTTLDTLQQKYNLYLFSNTNDLHISHFRPLWTKQLGYDFFEKFFKKYYLSHEIHLKKPKIESFSFILDDENLKAEETLFIDDTQHNVEGAINAGLKGYWLTNGQTLAQLLQNGML
jgi:putative hydrolase of the HAD superfamily